ncbi:MAG: hypothetical protein IJI37_02240, partial [Opitutales bacterium]|nr:hypothetical protein [Opitutales bacterium]
QHTHTYNPDLTPYLSIETRPNHKPLARSQADTNAILKREFSLAAVMHNSLWCFDMWGGVFSTPETMALVKRAHEIWNAHKDDNLPVRAEIVCVYDPASAPYAQQMQFIHMKHILFSCGAPFDNIFFDDVSKVDFSKYKVVVFPHSWEITPEKKKILDQYVFTGGKTVITTEGFGITDGKKLDPSFTEKLTGFKYKSEGVNSKDMGGWTSVYAGSKTNFSGQNFMDIIKRAGVHTYTDEPLPVYANEKLVAVHVKDGGKKTIYLPSGAKKVKELFSGRTIEVNGGKFDYGFASPDTALFELID